MVMHDGTGPEECTFTELTGEKCGITEANHTPVMPAVPIPAGYCGACARSGVGACDDFPNCPAGIKVTEGN